MNKIYICPKCGSQKELGSDSGKFCSNCGSPLRFSGYTSDRWNTLSDSEKQEVVSEIGAEAVAVSHDNTNNSYPIRQTVDGNGKGKVKCPRCKSRNVIAKTEVVRATSEIMGVILNSKKKDGLANSQSVRETYWICQDCGEQFRDMNELKDLIEIQNKIKHGFKIAGMIFAVLTMVFSLALGVGFFKSVIISLLCYGMFFFFSRLNDKSINTMESEYARIKAAYDEE